MLAALLPMVTVSWWDSPFEDVKLAGAVISATVTDTNGNRLYSRNSDLRVVPASNQKLLSAAFALWSLGPERKHSVRLWRDGKTVTVATEGAPLLSSGQLSEVAKEWGFADQVRVWAPFLPRIPDGWEFDDLPNKYAAPVGGFFVDRASCELWNQGGRVVVRPQGYGIRIRHLDRRGPLRTSYDPLKCVVTVSGAVPKESKRLDTLALTEPDLQSATWLGRRVARTSEVPTRKPDRVIETGTTSEIVAACLPPSDNQLAEQLLLLGSAKLGSVASDPYPAARKRMTDFLVRTVGVSPTDFAVYDGSGLSRHNLVTTRGIAQLLLWADRNFKPGDWHDAMAMPGKGTLASRLKGVDFRGKTGSLNNVFSLSGYVSRSDGTRRIVSVVVNHATGSGADMRGAIDRFIETVAKG